MLEYYRRWLLKMATVIAPRDPHTWQDLAQEGWVAMWRAERTYDPDKGALPSWLTTAAVLRMSDVYRRRTWLGTPMRRGHVREEPATPVDTDDFVELIDTSALDIDAVALAYHNGEIMAAINALPERQREYVYRRFWRGQSNVEIAAHLGHDPGRLWTDPNHGARQKLRQALAHLSV